MRIEPNDAMPEAYRRTLIRQISQHAHSEIVGMLPEGNWITRAPSLRRKAALLAKVQDEGGHGLYLYAAAETLGVSREELVDQLLTGRAKYSSIFNYPTLSWADIGTIGWLVDGAAIMNQIPLCRCSYRPAPGDDPGLQGEVVSPTPGLRNHAHAMPRHGGAKGDGTGRAEPLVVAVPDDVRAAGYAIAALRQFDAVEDQTLHQRFAAAEIRRRDGAAGIASRADVSDPSLRFDAARHWEFGEIDWDEFRRVLSGDGPCNRDRLSVRRKAHDDGAWVREAAQIWASKQTSREAA